MSTELRADISTLKLLVANDCLTEAEALHRASVPLFIIPFSGVLKDVDGTATQWIEGDGWSEFNAKDLDSNDVFEALMEPPFQEFASITITQGYVVYAYHRIDSEDGLMTYHECSILNSDQNKVSVMLKGKGVQTYPGSETVQYSLASYTPMRLSSEEKMRIIAEARWMVASWIVYNTKKSLTMMTQEIQPAKIGKKAGFNVRVNSTKKVNVIFLDRLPNKSTSMKEVGEMVEGCKKKPHARIGHRRVLSHPRYKNHPKYLDPWGIFVRSTWIGDITSMDAVGNVYTVHPSNLNS